MNLREVINTYRYGRYVGRVATHVQKGSLTMDELTLWGNTKLVTDVVRELEIQALIERCAIDDLIVGDERNWV